MAGLREIHLQVHGRTPQHVDLAPPAYQCIQIALVQRAADAIDELDLDARMLRGKAGEQRFAKRSEGGGKYDDPALVDAAVWGSLKHGHRAVLARRHLAQTHCMKILSGMFG
jgi:hypothetical protein